MNKDDSLQKLNKYLLSIDFGYVTTLNYEINNHIISFTKFKNYLSIKVSSQYLSYVMDDDIYSTNFGFFNLSYKKEDNLSKMLYEKIQSFEFNKYFCSYFYSENELELLKIETELFPDFFKNERKCSVCFEFTKNKTSCGHSLCHICWEEIIKRKNYKCPECRNCIRFTNTNCFDDNCDGHN